MPMPAIEATRHQRERSLPVLATHVRQPAGAVDHHQQREADREARQQRRARAAWALAGLRVRDIRTAKTITGTSIATRISLTTVATSPVSCDML